MAISCWICVKTGASKAREFQNMEPVMSLTSNPTLEFSKENMRGRNRLRTCFMKLNPLIIHFKQKNVNSITSMLLRPSVSIRLRAWLNKFMQFTMPSVLQFKITNSIVSHPRSFRIVLMDKFRMTLDSTNLTPDQNLEIATEMMKEVTGKKAMDTSKYDWSRVTWADPRDPRAVSAPCWGDHEIQKFGKGSQSGSNRWALWLACSRCSLRVAYIPTWGAPGVYRSAGPLPSDVTHHIEKKKEEKTPLNPKEMGAKKLGYEAAEASALRQLERIRDAREKLEKKPSKAEPKPKAKNPPSTMTATSKKSQKVDLTKEEGIPVETIEETCSPGVQSTTKRENPKTAEAQELETVQQDSDASWNQIS